MSAAKPASLPSQQFFLPGAQTRQSSLQKPGPKPSLQTCRRQPRLKTAQQGARSPTRLQWNSDGLKKALAASQDCLASVDDVVGLGSSDLALCGELLHVLFGASVDDLALGNLQGKGVLQSGELAGSSLAVAALLLASVI